MHNTRMIDVDDKLYYFLWQTLGFATSTSWTLVDLLIMMFSLGLTHRFQQINSLLKSTTGRVKSRPTTPTYWINIFVCVADNARNVLD